MSKNYYQMSAVNAAQMEIDYLREQLNLARKQMRDVDNAKDVLSKKGYAVQNLWHVDTITSEYECTREEAEKVLLHVFESVHLMFSIWDEIEDVTSKLELKKK